jgi:UDP-N-acetylmuramoylalanine--D-glutamate ligase
MKDLIATNRNTAILGLGATGLSVARFLSSIGKSFVFADSRTAPPRLDEVRKSYPQVPVVLGAFEADLLLSFDSVIVSPGIALDEPALVAAQQQKVKLLGDVELFLDHAKAPVVLITGSNGKSTVTKLVGEMAQASGLKVGVGGNLGTPMLDLLDDQNQLYVIELSSFQLELVTDTRGAISTILNISADHMDRYSGLQQYHAAKHRIFRGASQVIFNRQDALTNPLLSVGVKLCNFGLNRPDLASFGVLEEAGESWLAYGLKPLIASSELAIKGRHNIANALAAMALGQAAGLPMDAMLETLQTFKGLSHRCEYVATQHGVTYIDDSKGTNIGATVAALNGFGDSAQANLILIAGGQGKGQNFSELKAPLSKFVKLVALFGEDAQSIAETLAGSTQIETLDSMEQAVDCARAAAESGDIVLLSPACASFDMFSGFEERGRCVQQAVTAVAA